MKALLLRDRSFALVFAVFGAIALSIALTQDRFQSLWVFPVHDADATFHVSWIFGLVLGAFAALRDQVFGMRDYVRHRPLSAARLHAGRLLSCGVVLAVWWTVPPIVAWAAEWFGGDLVSFGSIGNYPDVLATMLPAATGAAMGLFAASLPCAYLLRLAVAAALLFAIFPSIDDVARVDGDWGLVARGPYVALHLLATAVLVGASFRTAPVDADADRPWVRCIGGPAATVALLALTVFATIATGSMASVQFARLAQTLPVVVDLGDRTALALRTGARSDVRYQLVDDEHRSTGEAIPAKAALRDWLAVAGFARDPELRRPNFHSPGGRISQLGEDGLLRWLQRSYPRTDSRWYVLGKGDAKTPFARGARVLTLGSDDNFTWTGAVASLWVVEPDARELWRLDFDAGRMVAVPLPGNDRVVASIEVERADGAAPLRTGSTWMVRGEHGAWWIGGEPLRAANADEIRVADAQRARRAERSQSSYEILDADVLAPTLRLLGRDGTGIEHEFAPHRGIERLQYGFALVFSLLRPPLLQVPVHVAGEVTPRKLPMMLDPVVAGGRRRWLLLAGCALAGIAAFRARQRLRALGADARTLRFWTVFVALTGPIGLLCCVLCETRRAWTMPAEAPAPPPPQIVTRVA